MIIIVTVDERNGLTFNGRRLSQDSVLRRYMLEQAAADSGRLWMNAYTRRMFRELDEPDRIKAADLVEVLVDEMFLPKAMPGDYCYVENVEVAPYEEAVESILYCRWNRRYPADRYLDLDMAAWQIVSTEEFAGTSHEKITVHRCVRKNQAAAKYTKKT